MKLLLAGVFALLAIPAWAQPYAFFDLAAATADTSTVDESGPVLSNLHLGAGYRFKYVSIEAAWLMLGSFNQQTSPTTSSSWSASGPGLSTIGMIPLTERFSLLAIAGIYRLKTDVDSHIVGGQHTDEHSEFNAPCLGAGIQFSPDNSLLLRAAVRRFEGSEEMNAATLFSFGVGFVF